MCPRFRLILLLPATSRESGHWPTLPATSGLQMPPVWASADRLSLRLRRSRAPESERCLSGIIIGIQSAQHYESRWVALAPLFQPCTFMFAHASGRTCAAICRLTLSQNTTRLHTHTRSAFRTAHSDVTVARTCVFSSCNFGAYRSHIFVGVICAHIT